MRYHFSLFFINECIIDHVSFNLVYTEMLPVYTALFAHIDLNENRKLKS